MFKKGYLVSYNYQSKKNGNGVGHISFDWYGKLSSNDLSLIISRIQKTLADEFKDNSDYFSIVILNIVKL